jgi:outer membrane receptor for ferrienterochelin and colicins
MCLAVAMAGAGAQAQVAATAQPAASAPRAAVAPAAAASAPAAELKRVEVTGRRPTEVDERRESTAAKIVIGREEIDSFGDSSLGDVLKRLPGVTIQGRPGRGGAIRMRGLGAGYTQILLDGQRVAPGFSLDSLSPEQVERIEILRAPTAETGARAIAGTINIITREGFVKHINDVRLVAAVENDRLQPSASWTRNDTVGAFVYNYSLTAYGSDRDSGAVSTTVDRNLSDDSVTLAQRDVGTVRDQRRGLSASGRLQWRGDQAIDVVTLQPFLVYSTGTSRRTNTLTQTVGALPPPYDTSVADGEGSYSLVRLNGQWNRRLDQGGRLEWKFGLGEGRFDGASVRNDSTAGVGTDTIDDRNATMDRNLLLAGKLIQQLPGDHSLVVGAEGEANRRTEQRQTVQNGVPQLTDFGENLAASATRFAAFAQDEWTVTPQWAVHAGLRWEGITTHGSGDDAQPDSTNRSSVWSPMLHAVWKFAPESRDQMRFSLTRSYRSPTLQSLIGRPSINSRYPLCPPDPLPCPPNLTNEPTHPDRAGNPDLQPELATGIDVAIERYLTGGGLLSANVFSRQIKNYMRSQTTLQDVSWSSVPRWVASPQNIGDAVTRGVELEAKFRLSEVVAGAPRVDLRANVSVFRSSVDSVPGPDNRLDQQPDYTANLGADYRVAVVPLTLGGNLNLTPAYATRVSETQATTVSRKLVIDAYGLWVFSPTLQLRVTASNMNPVDYQTSNSIDFVSVPNGPTTRETSATVAPTYLNLQFRLEIKL